MRALGPHDDNPGHHTQAELVDQFVGWLAAQPEHPPANARDVDLILTCRREDGDGHLTRWTTADVDTLLLHLLPRRLDGPPGSAAAIPASLAAFIQFLADTRQLEPRGLGGRATCRALAQQRTFLDVIAGPTRTGTVTDLAPDRRRRAVHRPDHAGTMADTDQATDEAAGQSTDPTGDAETRTDPTLALERIRIRNRAAGLPVPPAPERPRRDLRFRTLASADELDRRAPDVPWLRLVETVHDTLGLTGTVLTRARQVRLTDARRLAAATGVPSGPIRSSSQLEGFYRLLELTQKAGAVERIGNRIRAAMAWSELPPGARWQRVVDAVLDTGPTWLQVHDPRPVYCADLGTMIRDAVADFLPVLWDAGTRGAPEHLLLDLFNRTCSRYEELFPEHGGLPPGVTTAWLLQKVDDVLTVLADAGLATREANVARLTDAGARLLAPRLTATGFDIVLPETLNDVTVDVLFEVAARRRADAAELAAYWATSTSPPDPRVAAHVIVLTMTEGDRYDFDRVALGFELLAPFREVAADDLRQLLDTPLAPYAYLHLVTTGTATPADVPLEMVSTAGIGLFLDLAERGTPADALEAILLSVLPDEHHDFVDRLANGSHPRTAELLELLGHHHPDATVARHARKAAFRWRNARATGPV